MFIQMRRKKQQLTDQKNIEILKSNKTGVLAVYGLDDYPYTIPINYIYVDSKIYFHGAKQGHKIDAIKNNCKVSFCVIDKDELKPEEYTTYFRSVIVFGKIKILDNKEQMLDIINKLAKKFTPDDTTDNRNSVINKSFNFLSILELTPDYISGKESIELINTKND